MKQQQQRSPCNDLVRLDTEFKAYKRRYDSKVEGLETYNNILREVELPKIKKDVEAALIMIDKMVGVAKEMKDAVKESKSTNNKLFYTVLGAFLLQILIGVFK